MTHKPRQRTFMPRHGWQVCIDTTKPGLERLMRAIIMCRARVEDTMTLGDHKFGRGVSAWVMVTLYADKAEQFLEIANPIEMLKPSRPQIGMNRLSTIQDHPGDLRRLGRR